MTKGSPECVMPFRLEVLHWLTQPYGLLDCFQHSKVHSRWLGANYSVAHSRESLAQRWTLITPTSVILRHLLLLLLQLLVICVLVVTGDVAWLVG